MERGYWRMGRYLALGFAILAVSACSKEKAADDAAEAEQAVAAPATPAVSPAVSAEATEAAISHGKAIVEANCVSCHATEVDEKSAHASAPSFATLFTAYPPEYIAEAFAEGVFVGHGDMPAFEFTSDQIKDLVVYLKTLG